MNDVFHYLSFVTVVPAAYLYIFLLNDQWRLSRRGRLLLLAWSVAVSVPLPAYFIEGLMLHGLYLLIPLLASVLPLWWASRVRGARFCFVFLSGFLFAWLTYAASRHLAPRDSVASALAHWALDAVLLCLCQIFCRRAFLGVLHAGKKGWGRLCLIPLVLCAIFLSLISQPNYHELRRNLQVRVFLFTLLFLTLLLYLVIFSFFQKLYLWHEDAVDAALLDAQLKDLSDAFRRQDAELEASRILRHDLRHYLPLLSQCLNDGDREGAEDVLAAMRELTAAGKEDGP